MRWYEYKMEVDDVHAPDDLKEKLLAEDLWLSYFNRYLFEKAVITEKEFNRMTEKISLRRSECLLRRAMQ